MSDETPTKPMQRPSRRQRAKAHVGRHKKGYATATAMTVLVTALQMFGALGPLVCHMPFIHDTRSCLEQAQRAKEAAKSLDTMFLDSETGLPADVGLQFIEVTDPEVRP